MSKGITAEGRNIINFNRLKALSGEVIRLSSAIHLLENQMDVLIMLSMADDSEKSAIKKRMNEEAEKVNKEEAGE